jgi:hypothetical protein
MGIQDILPGDPEITKFVETSKVADMHAGSWQLF